jgi:hypothetical protein
MSSIILKFWNHSLASSQSKRLTCNIVEEAQDKYCPKISGVKSEQGYAVLIGFPKAEARV